MRKVVAGINMTLDGYCDHTAANSDDETYAYWNAALRNGGVLMYGRTTYQMMEAYWPSVVKNPTGYKPSDEFAVLIDAIPKVVFSRTLKGVNWKNTTLKNEIIPEEILELKQQPGKEILVCSPSLVAQFTQFGLVDEFRLVVHPVILGSGLVLFKNIQEKVDLKLLGTRTFRGGAIALNYSTTTR